MKKIIPSLIVCIFLSVGLFFYLQNNKNVVEEIVPLQNTQRSFPDTIDATVEGSLQDQINATEVTVTPQELEAQLNTPQKEQETVIEVFSNTLHKPLGMVTLVDGRVVISDADTGTITIFKDTDADYVSDEKIVIAQDLPYPSALAVQDDILYIALADRISIIPSISRITKITTPQFLFPLTGITQNISHSILVDAQSVYVSTSANCNNCKSASPYGAIIRYDMVTKESTPIAINLFAPTGLSIIDSTIHFADWAQFGAFEKHDGMYALQDSVVVEKMSFDFGSHPTHIAKYHGAMFPEWEGKWLVTLAGSFAQTTPKGYALRLYDSLTSNTSFSDLFNTSFIRGDQVRAKPYAIAIGSQGEVYVTDSYGGKVFVIFKK